MTSIGIILGSVRPGRWGEQVTNWIQARAQEAGLDASVVDLKEFDLPIFAEEPPSMVVPTQPEGVRLRETLEGRDGLIFVTPEYNQSVPGGLKNAIDYLPPSTLKDKPVGIVGYSWHDAVSARAHLRQILSGMGAALAQEDVAINLGSEFPEGTFTPSEQVDAQLRALLDALA